VVRGRFLVVTTDSNATIDYWLFIRTRTGGLSWSIRFVLSR
jgi:hypothetical protein